MIILKISTDFSRYPGARYYEDGPLSGEEFFDRCLNSAFKSALEKKEKLTVDLDDTAGYASSFLSESFGLLSERYSARVVLDNIVLISNDEPDWKDKILHDYVLNAHTRKKRERNEMVTS